MAMLTENPKPEPVSGEKPGDANFKAQYQKRFEDAVADAQYLLIYAASKCPKDINRDTIDKLINARRRVENKQETGPKEEADFWVAYQDIWKLVSPVTAESIKANLPIDKTTTSKARGTVNRHIVFTGFILFLLLLLQIYWVIGNQLTTQATELLQKESELSLQLSDNERESSALAIRYKQTEIDSGKYNGYEYAFYYTPEWERDILEYTSTKARLETNLELLKSQLERSSEILDVWSKPWFWLIEAGDQGEVIHNDKYAPLFDDIDGQIQRITEQLKNDPDGANEAGSQNNYWNAQVASFEAQLSGLFTQYNDLELEGSGIQGQFNEINASETLLSELGARQAEVQTEIESVNAQLNSLLNDPNADATAKSALETQLAGLQTDLDGIQEQINDAANQLNALAVDTTIAEVKSALEARLVDNEANKAIIRDQIVNVQSQIQFLANQQVSPEQIVSQLNQRKQELENSRKVLERQELADASREKSGQTQLAGQFVLTVLQSYALPLLYGILGAGSFVLRTLSRQIEKVIFSEEVRTQHLLRISLGALAGIMVGWFSFLIPKETTTFLGSVSPLAIAFLVGYNIELFFSWMDAALNRIDISRKRNESDTENEEQADVPQATPKPPSAQGKPSEDNLESKT